jgi:hypothetical protein
MRKLLNVIIMLLIPLAGFGQCDSNIILFVDSLGNTVDSNHTRIIYNENDTLQLDQLNDIDFKNQIGAFPGESKPTYTSGKHCVSCEEISIKIIDSIDINHDGVKELFLLRQWYCSVTPPDMGPYGEKGQQLQCCKYEVWDVKSNKKIYEVKNMLHNQMAVSTNVIKSSGYKFEVNINKFGSLVLSNLKGDIIGIAPEMGTYIFNAAANSYTKEETRSKVIKMKF